MRKLFSIYLIRKPDVTLKTRDKIFVIVQIIFNSFSRTEYAIQTQYKCNFE